MCLELGFRNRFIMLWQNCGNLEHLSCSLTIRRCDNWGVNVQESSLLEELMGSESKVVSYSSNSTESVGSWPQMRLLSHGLSRWSSLNWIRSVTVSTDSDLMLYGIDLELERLSFSWRFDQSSCYHVRRSHNRFFSLSESGSCFVDNNLQVVKA